MNKLIINKRQGFTMIEMLSALVIFVIFIGSIWPLFSTFHKTTVTFISQTEMDNSINIFLETFGIDVKSAVCPDDEKGLNGIVIPNPNLIIIQRYAAAAKSDKPQDANVISIKDQLALEQIEYQRNAALITRSVKKMNFDGKKFAVESQASSSKTFKNIKEIKWERINFDIALRDRSNEKYFTQIRNYFEKIDPDRKHTFGVEIVAKNSIKNPATGTELLNVKQTAFYVRDEIAFKEQPKWSANSIEDIKTLEFSLSGKQELENGLSKMVLDWLDSNMVEAIVNNTKKQIKEIILSCLAQKIKENQKNIIAECDQYVTNNLFEFKEMYYDYKKDEIENKKGVKKNDECENVVAAIASFAKWPDSDKTSEFKKMISAPPESGQYTKEKVEDLLKTEYKNFVKYKKYLPGIESFSTSETEIPTPVAPDPMMGGMDMSAMLLTDCSRILKEKLGSQEKIEEGLTKFKGFMVTSCITTLKSGSDFSHFFGSEANPLLDKIIFSAPAEDGSKSIEGRVQSFIEETKKNWTFNTLKEKLNDSSLFSEDTKGNATKFVAEMEAKCFSKEALTAIKQEVLTELNAGFDFSIEEMNKKIKEKSGAIDLFSIISQVLGLGGNVEKTLGSKENAKKTGEDSLGNNMGEVPAAVVLSQMTSLVSDILDGKLPSGEENAISYDETKDYIKKLCDTYALKRPDLN